VDSYYEVKVGIVPQATGPRIVAREVTDSGREVVAHWDLTAEGCADAGLWAVNHNAVGVDGRPIRATDYFEMLAT
jgi:hypothetical protein